MTTFINIDLACNDERGMPEGRAEFIAFEAGEHHVGLFSQTGPIAVSLPAGALVVGGVHYPSVYAESHVGNLCWERRRLSLEDARRLMRQLFEADWDLDEWTDGSPFAEVIREAGHDV